MNAQDLKNSILQLAIQGKLVVQRKEEGTAKKLIEKIKAEKEQLIKAKKIKKEKPLLEITEEEIPFEIPESWEWVRFDNISNLCGTGLVRSNAEQFNTAKYEYFKMNNIGNFTGKCDFDNMPMIYATDEEYHRYKLKEGDFLFNTRNSRELVGKTAVASNIGDRKVILNNNILKISFYGNIDPNYINYFFVSPLGRRQLNKFITNTTNVAAIYQKQLITLMVPLPPLEEQKRIVAKIEELMTYVEKYGGAHSKLEAFNKKFPDNMQKSILQYAIQGKLVKQREEEGTAEELYKQIQEEKAKLIKEGKIKKEKPLAEITEDEIPVAIPESWKWVRLGDIFQINPRNKIEDNVEVSFIPMALLEAGYKNEFSYEVKRWGDIKKGFTHFKDEDIVMAKITPCFQNLKSAVMRGLENGFGAGTTELHVFRPYVSIVLEYFLWFIKSPVFVSDCVANMSGTAGQQRVGKDILVNYLIPLPPLEEQNRIVAKIEEMMPYCQQLVK